MLAEKDLKLARQITQRRWDLLRKRHKKILTLCNESETREHKIAVTGLLIKQQEHYDHMITWQEEVFGEDLEKAEKLSGESHWEISGTLKTLGVSSDVALAKAAELFVEVALEKGCWD